MKKIIVVTLLLVMGSFSLIAQDAETIHLVQTPGEFEQKELRLEAGKSYIFDVKNEGVDKLLGFVVAPKGKTDKQYHIQEAYLYKTIDNGENATSNEVVLEKGAYVYFCPLNPTPQYTLIVE